MRLPAWTRTLARVWWVVVVGACSRGGSPEALAEVGVGEAMPDIELSGERPALVWVVGVEQCLGCELGDAAWTVRSLQRRLRGRIETVVVAVGEGREEDRKLVGDFLASQRISARLELRTRKRYLRHYRSTPLSAFYLVNRKAVVEAMIAAESAHSWQSADGRRDFAELVESIANEGIQAGEGSGMQK